MEEKNKTAEPARSLQERFVAAWGEMGNPELDGENPHFHNKYATLKSTLGVIREACARHGIAYIQTLAPVENGYVLKSAVVAGDGESMERSIFPVETPPNPQTFGSGLTYAKRQQAQADWGITGEPDDDANRAAGDEQGIAASRADGKPSAPRQPGKWERFKALKAEAVSLGVNEESIKEWMDATFKKDMKSYTKGDINICEGHVQRLIDSANALKAQTDDGAQEQQGGE